MSEFKTPLTTILEVRKHDNADALDICRVYGFEVITRKGLYKVGDQVIYIPIDSILSEKLETFLFPPGSKITLEKRRVRQIKIRKYPSQGMLISPSDIESVYGFSPFVLEKDYSEEIGVSKYDPPEKLSQGPNKQKKTTKKKENKNLVKYNGITNIKWYPTKFEGKNVVIQEKIHGSNCRVGIAPTEVNSLWRKFLNFFRLLPKYEFVYGSNNVQLQQRSNYKGFYGSDVYGSVLEKYNILEKLEPNEYVYGELYGLGIQKNYDYGKTEHEFIVFDVKKDGRWLNPDEVEEWCKKKDLPMVPILYKGPYDKQLAYELTLGHSILCKTQKVREGIVIKQIEEYDDGFGGRNSLKWISEDYLSDKTNTDDH